MKLFRPTMLLCCAVALMAQVPPPKQATPATPATPPMPEVKLFVENPGDSAPTVPPDRVVITVGDVKLTAAQLDHIIDTLNETYRPVARGAGRKQFAENIIRVLLLAQDGRNRKVDATESFKTQAEFARWSVLAGLDYEAMSKETAVPEADLHAYYDAHRKEYEQVRASHILIRAQGSPVPVRPGQKDLSDAEALAKSQDLRKQIAAGADFGALASKESDDAGSGAKGGDLGFFRRGQMVPTFEETAFKLKPGELSEPVKTQFGYHIIKVEGVKGFDEARADVERKVRPEKVQKKLDEMRTKMPVILDPEFFGAK
jgi:peptidyl-prolyl cis-trans isomerase C